MGATFSRVKNWVAEKLTSSDLNAEIDNVLTNLTPAGVDDASTNVAAMQVTTSPGTVGSESLATSLAGELERLRFMIGSVTGETQWYTAPSAALSEISTSVALKNNRITTGQQQAGSSQSLFLDPAGSSNTVTATGATSTLTYYIEGAAYSITTDVTLSSLQSAPSSNNTALLNNPVAGDEDWTKQIGEFGLDMMIDNIGSEISSLNKEIAAFKINNGSTDEYFIGRIESDRITDVRRGYFFDSSQAIVPRIAVANNDTITLLKIAWIFGTTAGALALTYNNPTYSKDQPSSPAVNDYWFDLAADKWKKWDSSSWVDADAHLIGVACTDKDGNTVGARGFDLYKNYQGLNTVELVRDSNTEVKLKNLGAQINVAGNVIQFEHGYEFWNITADLDSGVSEAASTTYYCYITEDGEPVISDVAPYNRQGDMQGYYHPSQTWRCVGEFFNDASQNISGVIDYITYDSKRHHIVTSVGSNALTVTLTNINGDPLTPSTALNIANRQTSGGRDPYQNTPVHYPLSLVISSGSTLATTSNEYANIQVYVAVNPADEYRELVLSTFFFEGSTTNTLTAEGGAGAADGTLPYANVAGYSAPLTYVGYLRQKQTTAGTWATAVETVNVHIPERNFRDGFEGTRASATTYRAAGAGFLIVRYTNGSNTNSWVGKLECLADISTSPPTTLRTGCFLYGHSGANYSTGELSGFCIPIQVGYYYRFNETQTGSGPSTTASGYWIPFS